MGWLTLANIESTRLLKVMEELSLTSHRATAIVAASFVEEHLTTLLKSRLVSDKKTMDELFRPDGAIGSFGVKIKIGYLSGLYSKASMNELIIINKIRNKFAHDIDTACFDVGCIKDMCGCLVMWEHKKIKVHHDMKVYTETCQSQNVRLIITMGDSVNDGEQHLPIIDLIDEEQNPSPAKRYECACRFFIAAFSILINTGHKPSSPML